MRVSTVAFFASFLVYPASFALFPTQLVFFAWLVAPAIAMGAMLATTHIPKPAPSDKQIDREIIVLTCGAVVVCLLTLMFAMITLAVLGLLATVARTSVGARLASGSPSPSPRRSMKLGWAVLVHVLAGFAWYWSLIVWLIW